MTTRGLARNCDNDTACLPDCLTADPRVAGSRQGATARDDTSPWLSRGSPVDPRYIDAAGPPWLPAGGSCQWPSCSQPVGRFIVKSCVPRDSPSIVGNGESLPALYCSAVTVHLQWPKWPPLRRRPAYAGHLSLLDKDITAPCTAGGTAGYCTMYCRVRPPSAGQGQHNATWQNRA